MAQNLAAKYRPKTLEDMTEQKVVVDIIRNVCETGQISNRNFLFIGSAGCGKTTLAKIMAFMLNGSSQNCIEIDAASYNGVESMRNIMSQAQSYPVGTAYKVFIIDECHALSSNSWQAALRTIEEQPAKSIFVWCLTGDGLVPTPRGLVRLDSIKAGDLVWDGDTFKKVTNFFDNGVKDCMKVTMNDGSIIQCTPDHKIQVLDGDQLVWERADELKEGDCLLSFSNYAVNEPRSDISPEEAWMAGYITGNGNYTSHSLDLYTPFHKWDVVKSYLDKLVDQKIFKDYIVDSDLKAEQNNIHDTRIHFYSDKYHPAMTQWYRKLGMDPNYTRGTKKIPQSMFECSKECILQFVEGWYFADGSSVSMSFFDSPEADPVTRKRPSSPFLYCSNHNMMIQLQQLLRSVGIYTSLRTSVNEITQEYYEKNNFIKPGKYVSHSLYVLHRPGFFRNEKLKSILLDKYSTMPRGRYKLRLAQLKISSLNARISPTMLTESGYDFSDKGKFMTVSSIENIGPQHVYDIEVEGSHQFVYNSFVVHNCTTNPEKIPATILSRVQTFQLSKISLKGIHDRLVHIIEEENKEGKEIHYDDNAVLYISRLANGGMRDAITLLDKSLSFSSEVTIENLQKSLGLPNYDDYFDLLNAIAKKDNAKIVDIVNTVYNSGVNFVKWFDGFFSFVTNIVKYIYLKDINQTMIPSIYQDKISGYGVPHAALCLKLSNKLVTLNQELKTSQYLQELAISHLCTVPTK